MNKIFEDYGEEAVREAAKENLLTHIKALMMNRNLTVERVMDALCAPSEDRADITSRIALF